MSLVALRKQNPAFPDSRLDEIVQGAYWAGPARRIVERVSRLAGVVCERTEDLFRLYEADSQKCHRPTTCSGFARFVGGRQAATPNSACHRELSAVLTYVDIMRRRYVYDRLTPECEYGQLRDGFAVLADKAGRPWPSPLPGPKCCTGFYDCDGAPDGGAADQSTSEDCASRRLLAALYDSWGKDLEAESDRWLAHLDEILRLMVAAGADRLGVNMPRAAGAENLKSINERLLYCRNFAQCNLDDSVLAAICEWAWEVWRMAQGFRIIRNARDAGRSKNKRCFCSSVTAITLALGTMSVWNNGSLRFEDFRGAHGLFGFDKRLSFCERLRTIGPTSDIGVECRRSFRELAGDLIRIRYHGSWYDLALTDRTSDTNGLGAESGGLHFSPFEDAFGVQLQHEAMPWPYVPLPSAVTGRLALRYLYDISEDSFFRIASTL